MKVLRSRQVWAGVVLASAIVWLSGCEGNVGGGGGTDPLPKQAEPRPSGVTVSEVRAEILDAAVKGYKDNVVVVDFWATWCGPCVKTFPHLVAMHKKYAEKGLVCVSVSMDKWEHAKDYQEENGKEKVLAFLKEKGASFPNFIATDPDGELPKLEARFGEFAGIPHMAIFDRGGRKVWDSESGAKLTDEQLDRMVEAELSK
ncbi:MAG: tlpA 2 [Gemmataceae bacterium]|nr:tlpA 2 [Gemmataceae bacterium]